MSQFILINRIKVQNANTIAGFTWGFPAITHFLGYTHNLNRKVQKTDFQNVKLHGCAVISHQQQIHTYGQWGVEFTQSRNPPYLDSHIKKETPPIIEEGKMNMTVSLLIEYKGNLGNRSDDFINWLENQCYLQRLAGGTIFEMKSIKLYSDNEDLKLIKRQLLPGFILIDRSKYLAKHYETKLQENPKTELLEAWMDFIALKQKARPKSNLITKHLHDLAKHEEQIEFKSLLETWQKELEKPFDPERNPNEIIQYFEKIEANKSNEKLLQQWREYCQPTNKTIAEWEYLKKPNQGYLVPIMIGYKAISPVYENNEIKNTRDNETPVCFVESIHSIGEWLSSHRIRNIDDLNKAIWYYHHEENWYLCKQEIPHLLTQVGVDFDDSIDED